MAVNNVQITNGTGSTNINNGTYSVSANVSGYDTSSITPTQLNIVEGTNSYDLTIAATGSLVIHVTEEGTSTGTPVEGAKFYRTDKDGNTYGNPVTTDSTGTATLTNLPYGATDTLNVYYKQTESDSRHTFSSTMITISLNTESTTAEIKNELAVARTFTLQDANYSGLPIESGTITLT